MASLDPNDQLPGEGQVVPVQVVLERHRSTSSCSAAKKRYSQSEKGRAVHRAAMRKYLSTPAGKEAAARATAKYKAKKRSLPSDI